MNNNYDEYYSEYIDEQTDNEFIENDGTVPVRKNMKVTMKNIQGFAIIIDDETKYSTTEEGMASWLKMLIEGNASVDELRNEFYLYLKYKEK